MISETFDTYRLPYDVILNFLMARFSGIGEKTLDIEARGDNTWHFSVPEKLDSKDRTELLKRRTKKG